MKIPNLMNRKKKNSVRENGHFRRSNLVLIMFTILVFLGTMNFVEASELLYYYDKYNHYPGESFSWTHNKTYSNIERYIEDYYWNIDSFTISRPNTYTLRLYVLGREIYMREPNIYENRNWNPTIDFALSQDINMDIQGNASYDNTRPLHQITVTMPAAKTTIHTENVVGTETQYPVNGLHTDGYWYVRKGLVNKKPQIIDGTQPIENKYFV